MLRWPGTQPAFEDRNCPLPAATFATLEASGAEVVQEPTDQPYGIRDCSFRDPAGNLIRIQEVRS